MSSAESITAEDRKFLSNQGKISASAHLTHNFLPVVRTAGPQGPNAGRFEHTGSLLTEFTNNEVVVKRKKLCRCLPDQPIQDPTIALTKLLSQLGIKYKFFMAFGALFAAGQGAVMPVFALVFGQLFGIFTNPDPSYITAQASIYAGIFVALGVYNLATGYLSQMLWGLVGEEVSVTYRREFFNALLRQEPGFYDTERTGKITRMLNVNIEAMRLGTGVKVANFLMYFFQAIVGIIIAFVYSWQLTLVLLSISPFIILGAVFQSRVLASGEATQSSAFSGANNLALEVVSSFNTVLSFVWEDVAREKFAQHVVAATPSRKKAAHLSGFAWGLSFFFIFATYSLGFWYGSILIAQGIPPPGSGLPTPCCGGLAYNNFLTVFMSIMLGALGLGQMMSVQPDFAAARSAGYSIFAVIHREPLIDPNPTGVRDVAIDGAVQFRNTRFCFPSRPTEEALKGVNLAIEPGQVVGIVGHSGAGKSTFISLVERFYDPTSGAVLIDGRNIKDYDLRWLRGKIGLVAQEPTLFDFTIAENIRFGKLDASDKEVEDAAKMANAHNFIMALPQGYQTAVGEAGSQLSGGQKQRIAIARAVLKDPRILLLDEATSALDTESESLVQDALNKLMKGRTTIVVAHRLSTIRDSDHIVVMDKGQIVEQGKHLELLLKRHHYYSLVSKQMEQAELEKINQEASLQEMESFVAKISTSEPLAKEVKQLLLSVRSTADFGYLKRDG